MLSLPDSNKIKQNWLTDYATNVIMKLALKKVPGQKSLKNYFAFEVLE